MWKRWGQTACTLPLQEGAKLREAIAKNSEDPTLKQFAAEDVHVDQCYTAVVSQDMLLLSEQQYINLFKWAHRVKDPKCPQLWIRNAQGDDELCWVFKDPSSPYRKLRIEAAVGEVSQAEVLRKADHLRGDQGQQLLRHSLRQRAAQSSLADVICKNACLSTLDEYMEKLQRRRSGSEDVEQGSLMEKEATEDIEEGDDEADAEAVKPSSDNIADHTSKAALKPMPLYTTPQSKSKKAKGSTGLSSSNDSKALQRAGSKASLATEEESDAGTTTTAAASAASKPKGKTEAEQCDGWIEKLSLSQVLSGKKLGVSSRHAENAAMKLNTKERVRLTAHLSNVRLALLYLLRTSLTLPRRSVWRPLRPSARLGSHHGHGM